MKIYKFDNRNGKKDEMILLNNKAVMDIRKRFSGVLMQLLFNMEIVLRIFE